MARRPDPDSAHRRKRLIITLTAIGVVLAAFVGVGIYGLIIGEPTPPTHTSSTPTPGDGSRPTAPSSSLEPLPRTTDPERFARAAATALFTWDTFTILTPQDHREVLVQAADPTGMEVPGLVADLEGYLPNQTTWTQLQEYHTRQWLQIDRIFVPEQWDEAKAAGGDALPAGTIAYTIEGVRHRSGVWFDKPVTSEHPVAFTIFLACAPATDHCALLRLSILDKPLR